MLRVFHHYFSARKLAFFSLEAVAIATGGIAGTAAVVIGASRDWVSGLSQALPGVVLLALFFAAALQFCLYALDLYDFRVLQDDRQRVTRVLKGAGAAAIFAGFVALALKAHLPQGSLLGGALGGLCGAIGARTIGASLLASPRRLLLLGNGHRARAVASAIADQGDELVTVSAMVDPTDVLRGGPDSLVEVVRKHEADVVVVACDDGRGAVPSEALLRCRLAGTPVHDAAGFCERVLRRIPVAFLRASDLAYADELTQTTTRRLFKRSFDLVMASLLFLVALPVMAVVALLIKLDSRGPIFYRQERVGLGGRAYRLWKFRSMRTDAEKDGAVWAKANDDRVTRVGRFIRKTRMDEIPQVFNVLVGEMSFVGPRPERPVFVDQLKTQIPFYGLRDAMKPGITGWAQIRYPYGASVEDARNKLEFDLYYVKNGSLFLDLAIIFHTVRHVLLGRGAR